MAQVVTGNATATQGQNVTGTINTSIYNFLATPNVIDVFSNKYGEQTARLMLELAGRVVPIQGYDSTNPLTLHINQNRIHEAIQSDGSGFPSSSTSEITVGVASSSECDPVQVGQSLWVENSDGDFPEFIVTEVNSGNPDIKVKSFNDSDPNVPTGSQITMYLGPNNGGENSGQPDALSTDMTTETFKPFESKETVELTGDAQSKEYYYEVLPNGYRSVWYKEQLDAEGRMNIKEDMKALMGEKNANSVTVSTESGTTSAHSSEGWYQIIDRLGGKLDYGNDFSVEYLDQMETFLESWNVTGKNLVTLCGSGFLRKMNKVGLDLIQQYDSGTSLVENLFQGNNEMAFKANITSFQYGAITLSCQPLQIFNDITMFGEKLNNSGLLFPLDNVATKEGTFSNIGLGYTQKGDVSLKRIVNEHRGMTKQHGVVESQYSSDRLYYRSQLTPFLLGANQMLLLRDQ